MRNICRRVRGQVEEAEQIQTGRWVRQNNEGRIRREGYSKRAELKVITVTPVTFLTACPLRGSVEPS